MAYMVEDFYRPGAVMDFPLGGSKGIIDALARGVRKRAGCSVETSSRVEEVLVEDGACVGVRLAQSGRVIRARQAVVSNADLRATFDLVPSGANAGFDQERAKLLETPETALALCKSFMHVHLAVPASAIPEGAPPQWTVCSSWDCPIDSTGNVVVVSVPSMLDASLAPPGFHVIHAYTAGNEPYADWERFEPLRDASARRERPELAADYRALKEQRAQPIFDAIAKRAPDARREAVVEQIASPLTHARFLNRHRGNYGLAIAAGSGVEFPAVKTPLPGYYRCGPHDYDYIPRASSCDSLSLSLRKETHTKLSGRSRVPTGATSFSSKTRRRKTNAGDSTTAGIGVPAVASSGAQCANALMSVWEQLDMNSAIRM